MFKSRKRKNIEKIEERINDLVKDGVMREIIRYKDYAIYNVANEFYGCISYDIKDGIYMLRIPTELAKACVQNQHYYKYVIQLAIEKNMFESILKRDLFCFYDDKKLDEELAKSKTITDAEGPTERIDLDWEQRVFEEKKRNEKLDGVI